MRAASLIASFIALAWTGPTSAPPSGNVSAPINVGTTDQVKDAGLALNALAVFGNAILSGASRYLNFGTLAGSSGYGIRDSGGTMQFKNSGGSWSAFATTTSGSSQWTTSGSSIYYNGGNVGIGTTNPGQKLTVAGTIETTSGGIKFPDGTTQTSAASSGGGGSAGWTICTNENSDSDGTGDVAACIGAALNGGAGTSSYRVMSCKIGSSNPVRTGVSMRWSGAAWQAKSGDAIWESCDDGTALVAHLSS